MELTKIDNIVQLQTAMQTEQGVFSNKIEPHILHYQVIGLYAREMWLPAGTLLVGKTHKKGHLCIISKGKVKVVSEELTSIIEAPYTYVSKRGAKRAMFAFSDTVWTTVHNVNEIDLNKIEEELVQDETYLGV